MSHSAAIFLASASSSFFSPLLKRQFSSSTTFPGSTETPSSQLRLSGTSTPSSTERCFAPGERVPDSGQRSADARIVDYFPGLDWNVEIHPHEDPLFAQVEIRHFEDGHEKFGSATTCSTGFQRAFINATVASSIRLL